MDFASEVLLYWLKAKDILLCGFVGKCFHVHIILQSVCAYSLCFFFLLCVLSCTCVPFDEFQLGLCAGLWCSVSLDWAPLCCGALASPHGARGAALWGWHESSFSCLALTGDSVCYTISMKHPAHCKTVFCLSLGTCSFTQIISQTP